MAPELQQRVRQLVDQALDCPEAERKRSSIMPPRVTLLCAKALSLYCELAAHPNPVSKAPSNITAKLAAM